MVLMSRRSLELCILVSFALLAVCFAGFFERDNNTTEALLEEEIVASGE
jgi:hypothetical protein